MEKISGSRRTFVPKTRDMAQVGTMTFLEKVEKLLDDRHWTQEELESRAGLPRTRISRWKSGVGKGPSVDEGLRIARCLEVSLDDLADESRAVPGPLGMQRNVVVAGDSIPSTGEILWAVCRGLGIDLEEAIRRLSTPSGPVLDVEHPKKRPG